MYISSNRIPTCIFSHSNSAANIHFLYSFGSRIWHLHRLEMAVSTNPCWVLPMINIAFPQDHSCQNLIFISCPSGPLGRILGDIKVKMAFKHSFCACFKFTIICWIVHIRLILICRTSFKPPCSAKTFFGPLGLFFSESNVF